MFALFFGVLALEFALISGNGCSQPLSISNGRYEFIDSPDWPQTICRVHYSCDLGYQLNGTGIVYCFHSSWIGDTPVCKEINCGELKAPGNGSMSFVDNQVPANDFESIVEFRCDEGFQLEGEVSLICQASGKWSADVPSCVPDVCDIDECSSNPCQNNGTCHADMNTYSCTCADGFSGTNCETAIVADCSDNEFSYNNICYFISNQRTFSQAGITTLCTNQVTASLPAEILNIAIQDKLDNWIRTLTGNYENFWTGGQYNVAANTVMWNQNEEEAIQFNWRTSAPYTATNNVWLYMTVQSDPASSNNGMFNYPDNWDNYRVICQHN